LHNLLTFETGDYPQFKVEGETLDLKVTGHVELLFLV